MRRFFVEPEQIVAGRARITGADARHAAVVLRLAAGVEVLLCDGSGREYEARLEKVTPQQLLAVVGCQRQVAVTFSPFAVAQALLKGSKMDFLVQKATELGASSFFPVITSRAEGRVSADRVARWGRIAREACKQCGRALPPDLAAPFLLNTFLVDAAIARRYPRRIFCWEKEKERGIGAAFASPPQATIVLVGPEGGFSSEEAEMIHAAAFLAVGMGTRILRSETASFAAMVLCQHALGNLSPPLIDAAARASTSKEQEHATG